jgi:hypothetical protein
LNWAPISLSARTTLFKKYSINYSASFSLYALDSNGQPYNKFIWETDNKFWFKARESMNTSLSWSYNSKKPDNSQSNSHRASNTEIFEQPAALGIEWSISIGYNIGYNSSYAPRYYRQNIWGYDVSDPFFSDYDRKISQSLTFNGNVKLTQKWNITYNSGFDFKTKKLSQTSFGIHRDLHCWDMNFTWSPFGLHKQWTFGIKLQSAMLKEALKYDKQKSIREGDDYF